MAFEVGMVQDSILHAAVIWYIIGETTSRPLNAQCMVL
jgi:hypothetical protein